MENIPEEKSANQDYQIQTNLHNTQSISPLGSANNLPVERSSACFEWKFDGIVFFSTSQPGKNVYQEIDAITKERPTTSDIENMKKSDGIKKPAPCIAHGKPFWAFVARELRSLPNCYCPSIVERLRESHESKCN